MTATSSSDSSKNYGIFTLKYLVVGKNPIGKTNLFIGQVIPTTPIENASGDKFKCSLETLSLSKECKIYKIKTQATDTKTYRDIEILSEISSPVNKDEIKDNELFVVDLKENVSDIKRLQEKHITLYFDTTTPKKTQSFTRFLLISPLSDDASFTKDSKPIILG